MTPIFTGSRMGFGGSAGGRPISPIVTAALGSFIEGGYLICRSSGVGWIVAPNTSQVLRQWHTRNDANTRAQQVSGCTGWFIPSISQLQNPGYACRSFWDSFCTVHCYWSNTEYSSTLARLLVSSNGSSYAYNKNNYYHVRSFRCVTY